MIQKCNIKIENGTRKELKGVMEVWLTSMYTYLPKETVECGNSWAEKALIWPK